MLPYDITGIVISKSSLSRDSPGGPVGKTLHSQRRGPGCDPWSGNSIPHVATKTWHSQINKYFKTKNKSCLPSTQLLLLFQKLMHFYFKDANKANKPLPWV